MTTIRILLFTLCIFSVAQAEVITDGSLGARVELPGKDFQITPELGQQFGSNLFHSFQQFNLSEGETATFSGANSVQNIITRVTGGSPSLIDGTLRSTIPNADLYFLNPYGIMFGLHAKLDLQGGFHVSTADYLRLQDGGRFEARTPSNSLLTVAPVTAFGFLTDTPAPIQTHSSKLSVPAEQTLSLIGGDLQLVSDTSLIADNSSLIPAVTSESILATEHGRVNLVSVATRGEVIPTTHDLIVEGKGGTLTINNTLVELSGNGGGEAFVRAGQFILDNAILRSNTLGTQDGKNFSIKATDAIYLRGINSEISLVTASERNTGNIVIDSPYLEVTNSTINTGSILSTGATGSINIRANQLFLKEGAMIATATPGAGNTGDLNLEVTDLLSLSGYYPGWRFTHGQPHYNTHTVIFSLALGTGSVGNIVLNTKNLEMDYSDIVADAFGTGAGGDITVQAQSIRLTHTSGIGSTTYSTAQAGFIKVRVAEQLYIGGWYPDINAISLGRVWINHPSFIGSGSQMGTGKGGLIDLQAKEVILSEDGFIGTNSWNNSTGDAGEIYVTANTIRLSDGGNITASAERAGGGNINLFISNLLYLHQGQITTSVKGGLGNGGNISLNNPAFIVLNQAQIKAQADAGQGGNIRIAAQQFVPSVESVVSASSNLGVDGQITIDSPTEDIGSQVLNLSANYLNAASLFPRSCAAKIADQRPSEFVRPFTLVMRPKTMIAAPEDTRASSYPVTMHYKWFDQYR